MNSISSRDGRSGAASGRLREAIHVGRRRRPRVLQHPRLVALVHQVLVGGVGLLRRRLHRDPPLAGEGEQVAPPLESFEEGALLPRRDHRQLGRQRGVGELEADLVVPLAGGAVGDGVGAGGQRHLDLAAGDQRARQGRAEQVAVLVDGVAGHRREDEVGDELFLQVFDVDLGGAGGARPLGDGGEVLALADVGDEGDHLVAALLEDLEDAGGVEPAAIGENDSLGVRGLGHRRSLPPGVEVNADPIPRCGKGRGTRQQAAPPESAPYPASARVIWIPHPSGSAGGEAFQSGKEWDPSLL